MAGYRPKSLDELNSMYGKTLAAEKAIKKGTDLIANDDYSSQKIDAIKQKEQHMKSALETAYNAEVAPTPVEEPSTAESFRKPEITHVTEPIFIPVEAVQEFEEADDSVEEPEAAEEVLSFEETEATEEPAFEEQEIAEEEPATEEIEATEEELSFAEIETTEEELTFEEPKIAEEPAFEEPAQTPVAHSSFRADLMDDYMKIMSDEDDDDEEFPSERRKLSRKEKKRLKKQNDKSKDDSQEIKSEAEEAQDIPLAEPEAEAQTIEEEVTFTEDIALAEETVQQANSEEEVTVSSDDFEDIVSNSEENSFTIETDDDFNFPEDYKPEWMKEKEEEIPVKEKTSPAFSILKGLLSLVVILAVAVASFATTFKCIFSVDTGKAFADTYYAFTAKENYEFANILAGDFVITEKVYAEDGDVFAYINYDSKTFEFAKRTKSITNADEVIIVGEKDEERVLVSRDDSRGVLYATYTGIGTLISMLCDNYIIVMIAAAFVALGASIIIIIGSRSKKEEKAEDKEAVSKLSSEDIFEEENIFEEIG